MLEKVNDQSQVALDVDTVIFAVGIRPQFELAEELQKAFPSTRVVGDASRANTVFEAIRDAFGASWVFEP